MLLRRLGFVLTILALFTLARGHWIVLQTVAWGQMIVAYSQAADGDLATGISKTFSGEAPCSLCLQLDAERAKEKQAAEKDPAKQLELKDVKFGSLARSHVFLPPWGLALEREAAAQPVWEEIPHAPDAPPPRWV